MISLQTAENVLRDVYLGVLGNQLNCNICPLLGKIKHLEILQNWLYGIN